MKTGQRAEESVCTEGSKRSQKLRALFLMTPALYIWTTLYVTGISLAVAYRMDAEGQESRPLGPSGPRPKAGGVRRA